ncbi:MAG: PadR family transcriptional regulator, partial [Nanoarchaeota archaeon]
MNEIYKGTVSYNLGKNILFDKIDYGESFLILYSNTNAHKQIFQNFMRQIKDKNSIVFFVSHKTNELNFSFDVRKFSFSIINDEVLQDIRRQLDKCFSEIEENNKTMLLIADWSNVYLKNCELFLPFVGSIIKKSQTLNPPGWKRKYRGIQYKTPFFVINAFEATKLDDEFTQELVKIHKRVYLMQENLNTFLLPAISPLQETIFPKQHVLPQNLLEKLVKDNLELIAVLFLEDGAKSGYQILKDVAKHFHCILSQGTLYPLLYQL